jgi:hypothetical protein
METSIASQLLDWQTFVAGPRLALSQLSNRPEAIAAQELDSRVERIARESVWL